MGRKKDNIGDIQGYNFKFLLYPDNPDHVQKLDLIKQQYPEHIGILHNETLERKPHYHIMIHMDKPKMMKTIIRGLEWFTEIGEPDFQFIRKVDGRYTGFLVYLTHLSEPDKEQYNASQLFGSSALLSDYGKAATKWMRKEFDMSDCVLACLDWIRQQDNIIRMSYFARWICNTPYFKASSSRLVIDCIAEHNQRIYAQQQRFLVDQISDGAAKLSAQIEHPEISESLPDIDLDDYEELIW